MNNVAVIILAGGQGTRFGSKKQFVLFKGQELWKHIYNKILKFIPKENIVVVGVDIEGGLTRSGSVINGLQFLNKLNQNFERVLILEAARPLVTSDQLETILNDNHLSTTFSLPLVSTIIKKDKTYLDRNDYCKLSTPVIFDYDLFSKAYLSGKYNDYTDDTRVMYEEYGIKPHLLVGAENLLKLTYKSDLLILEKLSEEYEQ